MKGKIFAINVVLFMSLLVNVQSYSEEIDTIKIRLPWLHQSQYAGVYVAQEKGFFAKRGLPKVEILQGGPNIRPMDLVSSGSEHFSITGSSPFLRAYKEKRPVKIVATFDQTHAFCYFARKDRDINSPADFKGKRVGHKIMHEHNLLALLKTAGLSKEDIELVPVPPGMSMFFLDNRGKMVPIWPGHAADEPLFAEERGIEVNYFFPEEYDGIPRIGNLLFTSKTFEQKHPELVEQVVGAIIEGWYDAFEHVEEAVDFTLKYQRSSDPNDRKHQKNMLLKMKEFMLVEKYGSKIGWCDAERWQQTLEAFLKDQPDASFTLDEILTDRYVEAYYHPGGKK
ncbi:MAG: ABC transporter substrate-binding protein [bacterium]|nr:ABC transporter substrate-binding protein [bacterium]